MGCVTLFLLGGIWLPWLELTLSWKLIGSFFKVEMLVEHGSAQYCLRPLCVRLGLAVTVGRMFVRLRPHDAKCKLQTPK